MVHRFLLGLFVLIFGEVDVLFYVCRVVWVSEIFLLQFRPVIPAQPGQTFISSSAQQFQLAGQNISSSNVGVPAGQVQPHQYPQSMPQLVPRPGHPSYVTPSSQPIQMPYVQTRQLTSVPPQSQQNVAAPNNHMHGLGAHGVPLSSPYTVILTFITRCLLAFSVHSRIRLFIYYYCPFCLVYSLSTFDWHPMMLVSFLSSSQCHKCMRLLV